MLITVLLVDLMGCVVNIISFTIILFIIRQHLYVEGKSCLRNYYNSRLKMLTRTMAIANEWSACGRAFVKAQLVLVSVEGGTTHQPICRSCRIRLVAGGVARKNWLFRTGKMYSRTRTKNSTVRVTSKVTGWSTTVATTTTTAGANTNTATTCSTGSDAASSGCAI